MYNELIKGLRQEFTDVLEKADKGVKVLNFHDALNDINNDFECLIDLYENGEVEDAKEAFREIEEEINKLKSFADSEKISVVIQYEFKRWEIYRDACEIVLFEGAEDKIKKEVAKFKEWLIYADTEGLDVDTILDELEGYVKVMRCLRHYCPTPTEDRIQKIEEVNKDLIETYAKYMTLPIHNVKPK